jgi:hypothetical protein
MTQVEQEIIRIVRQLDPARQQQVLDFIHRLERPRGIPGEELVARARQVSFDPADLETMRQAIEEECERIDWDEWDLPA